MSDFPKRLNKHLAELGYATRREADILIAQGSVLVNGTRAVIGQKVSESDSVEVKGARGTGRYFAYNKPRGMITHSPRRGETDIAGSIPLKGVFPIGRLDKDSHGLIILTDDGRVTDRLLNPKSDHQKEYIVTTVQRLRPSFAEHMQKGVDIGLPGQGGYTTKPCKVRILGEKSFSIILTEGKKHQIRRMCAAMHVDVEDLQRVRIQNVELKGLKIGGYRPIEGSELKTFLSGLGL